MNNAITNQQIFIDIEYRYNQIVLYHRHSISLTSSHTPVPCTTRKHTYTTHIRQLVYIDGTKYMYSLYICIRLQFDRLRTLVNNLCILDRM